MQDRIDGVTEDDSNLAQVIEKKEKATAVDGPATEDGTNVAVMEDGTKLGGKKDGTYFAFMEDDSVFVQDKKKQAITMEDAAVLMDLNQVNF